MGTSKFVINLVMVFGIISCGLFESNDDNIPDHIDDFVSNYSFEKQQATKLLYRAQDENMYIFLVQYGDGVDCPSGCIYQKIIGMKLGGKIGWLEDNYFPDNSAEGYELFDVMAQDTILFAESKWEEILAESQWLFSDYYIPTLARDPEVPAETLLLMIDWLKDMTYRDLHEIILSNPITASSDVVLQGLACLPADLYGYNPYSEVIDSAKTILGDRFVGCD